MLIAQITDLHIKAERAYSYGLADTCLYLEAIEEHLLRLRPALDGLVITGDLADLGELKAYEFVKSVFARWQVPIYAVPGNHDLRGDFLAELSDFCPIKRTDGLLAVDNLSYVVNLKGARLVVVDTVEEGKHSGRLQAEAAEWLKEVLSKKIDVPTLVFTHHPPFASGLGAMDEPFENSQTFIEILSDSPQNLTLCLGHLHRALTTSIPQPGVGKKQIRAIIAPPVAMPIELEIGPDGGRKFFLNAPGFVLHHIEEMSIISHFETIPGAWPFSGPHYFE